MISRTEEQEVHELIKQTFDQLTKEKLSKAFADGKSDYIADQPDTNWRAVRSAAKTICTFGFSDLFRFAKAELRLPMQQEIEKDEPKEILKNFLLSGSGGMDRQSLKYHVVSRLLDLSAKSDQGANELVNMVLRALGCKVESKLSAVSDIVKRELEREHNKIFTL